MLNGVKIKMINPDFLKFISKSELDKLENQFKRFFLNRRLQNKNEMIINFNRLIQNSRTLLKNYFVLPKIFKSSFDFFILNKKVLRSVELSIGYKCNSYCEQCSCALSYDKNRKRLSLNEFKKIVDDSIALGAFQFNLTGGEPLLYPNDTFGLIKYIRKRKRYVHLCSNGLLLNKKMIKRLSRAGLCSLEMGLDSASRNQHDGNRRIGSFDKIMGAVSYANRFGIPIILNTIITSPKIKSGDLLASMKLAKKINATLQITSPCLMGYWKGKREILLNKKERKYLRWLLHFSNIRMDTFSSFTGIRCSAGREKIAINPYGDVLPCSLVQLTYGNTRDESLKTIWNRIYQQPDYHKNIKEGCLASFDDEFIKKHNLDQPLIKK